jgi:LysM repeat protein
MKFLRVLCLATILSVAPAGMIVAQSTAGHFIHTVTKGQSLYSISSMYNVSIADIVKENPGSDAGIKVGQSLKIPQNGDNQVTFHTIQSGETLYKLSVKYGVSVERICQANPGLSAKNFRVDQVIAIPPVAKSEQVSAEVVDQLPALPAKVEKKDESLKPNCRDMHRVERKETVYSICKQYGITEEELLAANPEIKNKKLKKGKFLCIPYPKETANTTTPTQTQTNLDATLTDAQLFDKNKKKNEKISTIKAAVVLPFNTDGTGTRDEQVRMVE